MLVFVCYVTIILFQINELQVRFNIIGAGRLGKNLAVSLMSRGDELIGVCNRRLCSAWQQCMS